MRKTRKMSYILRGAAVLLLAAMSLGFRTLGSSRWNVTPTDPTIWIKLCDSLKTVNFTEVGTSGDPLSGSSDLSMAHVLQSILDDYNGVSTWYARLAVYPSDDSTLPASRTIHVCTGSMPAAGAAGVTAQHVSGNAITDCEITLTNPDPSHAIYFVRTLTHELGHCFGLAHPQESTQAVMSYFSDAKRLQNDDKAGLSYFYPSDGSAPESEQATGGFSCAPR